MKWSSSGHSMTTAHQDPSQWPRTGWDRRKTNLLHWDRSSQAAGTGKLLPSGREVQINRSNDLLCGSQFRFVRHLSGECNLHHEAHRAEYEEEDFSAPRSSHLVREQVDQWRNDCLQSCELESTETGSPSYWVLQAVTPDIGMSSNSLVYGLKWSHFNWSATLCLCEVEKCKSHLTVSCTLL